MRVFFTLAAVVLLARHGHVTPARQIRQREFLHCIVYADIFAASLSPYENVLAACWSPRFLHHFQPPSRRRLSRLQVAPRLPGASATTTDQPGRIRHALVPLRENILSRFAADGGLSHASLAPAAIYACFS